MRPLPAVLAFLLAFLAANLVPATFGGVLAAAPAAAAVPDASSPPAFSVSRYLGDLTADLDQDLTTMDTHGCDDAATRSTLVLLDVGAQSVTGPELSPDDPGVALALSDPTVRLDYADLRTLLTGYLTGFYRCQPAGQSATVALGTSNSGAFSGPDAYPGMDRGTAWADEVVDAVAAVARESISVVGAVDIENGGDFDPVLKNAQDWEDAYLVAAEADLLFNGAPIGCPSTPGVTDGMCSEGWSQADFFELAHNGSRISVLPQIYVAEQAEQWADIDAAGATSAAETGTGAGPGELVFAGALTQHALDDTTFTPAEGWAALVDALSGVVGWPSVPGATDLRVG